MVITKSISRFARNTLDTLTITRELKNLGIDVYFERERIHSVSSDGELMLTILASFAQEESRSVSENCKWQIRNSFKNGDYINFAMFRYKIRNKKFKIVPEEAEIVREIFYDFLSGMGRNAIMKKMIDKGYKTKFGKSWNESAIDRMLKNEKYSGDMLLQKRFTPDHLNKIQVKNNGELPMYYVKNGMEAIIDKKLLRQFKRKLKKDPGLNPSNAKELRIHLLLKSYVENAVHIIKGKYVIRPVNIRK